MKLEVLLATMHQTDHQVLERIQLQSDAVVVNQCDRDGVERFEYRGYQILWINTTQRGLSKSRNMALSYASGDICLLADDDIVYADGYADMVVTAFREEPKADVIAFNTWLLNVPENDGAGRVDIRENRKAPRHSYYGSVRLAFRLTAVRKRGLHFNEILGAGTAYGSGEESVFLRQGRKNGLQIYVNKGFLASVDYGSSTWFAGYNEKFYRDKGVFLAVAYGRSGWLFAFYYVLQSLKISELSPVKVYRCLLAGMKEYRNL